MPRNSFEGSSRFLQEHVGAETAACPPLSDDLPETWRRRSAGRKKQRELSKITRNAKSVRIIAHVLIVSEARS